MRRYAVPGAASYAIVCLVQAAATLGYLFELLSDSLADKCFWDDIQWLPLLIWPFAFLYFSLKFTGEGPKNKFQFGALSIPIPAFFAFAVFTNDRFHLLRGKSWIIPGEPFGELAYDITTAGYAAAAIYLLLLFSSLAVLASQFIRPQKLYRMQLATIFVGALIPALGVLLILFGVSLTFHRDTTPIWFALSNLVIAFGLFRLKTLDVMPIARDKVLEELQDAVWVMDNRNRLVDINPVALRLSRETKKPHIGKDYRELFDNWPEATLFASNKTNHSQVIPGPNGEGYFELRISSLQKKADHTSGYLLTGHNVTEKVRAERILQETNDELERRVAERTQELVETNGSLNQLRNLLSNIINSMPSVLVGVDWDGRVTQWNIKAEEATGIQSGDAVGQPIERLFPDMAQELPNIARAIAERVTLEELRYSEDESGQKRQHLITIYPLISNGMQGAVIRLDDVTERMRLQQVLIQTEKMMSVGGLAAGMAHEMNNPLAGIIQNLQVVQNRLVEPRHKNRAAAEQAGIRFEQLQQYVAARSVDQMISLAQDSARRASKIVNNMLSFARQNNEHISRENVCHLLDQVVEIAGTEYNFKKQFDFRRIDITREYETPSPMVECESSKIQQVFLNILKNGAEAMSSDPEKETKRPCFRLRVSAEREMMRIEIEDNGPGMTEEVRKRVFDPFFTTKDVGLGTGLGLSVSYFIIADNHKGSMAVESTPGQGSKFVIRLPIDSPSSN